MSVGDASASRVESVEIDQLLSVSVGEVSGDPKGIAKIGATCGWAGSESRVGFYKETR